jgi:hypothetical protein
MTIARFFFAIAVASFVTGASFPLSSRADDENDWAAIAAEYASDELVRPSFLGDTDFIRLSVYPVNMTGGDGREARLGLFDKRTGAAPRLKKLMHVRLIPNTDGRAFIVMGVPGSLIKEKQRLMFGLVGSGRARLWFFDGDGQEIRRARRLIDFHEYNPEAAKPSEPRSPDWASRVGAAAKAAKP